MKIVRTFAMEFWRLSRLRLLSILVGMTSLVVLSYDMVSPAPGQDELNIFYSLFWVVLIAYVGVLVQCRDETTAPLAFEPRLFRLPVSTLVLVASKMSLSMIALVLMYLATAGMTFVVSGYVWPIWGPALFVATVLAWVLALAWALSGVPLLRSFVGLAVSAVLVGWAGPRFGAEPFGQPTRMWWAPTVGEGLTLLGMIVAAFAFAVAGVARDRRGETWALHGLFGWLSASPAGLTLFPPRRRLARRFNSPTSAQFWLEWRQKGWAMPLAAVGGLTMIVVMGSLNGLDTGAILRGLFPILVMILVGFPPIIGFLMGRFSVSSHEPGLGIFRATRPLSDSQLAGVLLKAGTASLLLSWFSALVTFGAILGFLHQWGDREKVELIWTGLVKAFEHLGMGTTLGACGLLLMLGWVNMAMVACIILSGRNWMVGALVETPYGLVIGYFLLRGFLPDIVVPMLIQIASWAFGSAALMVAILGFVVARRRGLIGPRTPWIALAIWLASACGAAFYGWDRLAVILGSGVALERSFVLVALGVLALVTAPPALAPLAVEWNRHR